MIRGILSLLLGIIASGVVVALVEKGSHSLFPPPEGIETMTPEQFREAIAGLPSGAFIAVILAWALGAAIGTWVTLRVSRHRPWFWGGIFTGVFLLVVVFNLILIPHPWWMNLASPMVVLGASMAGGLLGRPLGLASARPSQT
jgi:hypothetical protein